jgi:hypothetical protein
MRTRYQYEKLRDIPQLSAATTRTTADRQTRAAAQACRDRHQPASLHHEVQTPILLLTGRLLRRRTRSRAGHGRFRRRRRFRSRRWPRARLGFDLPRLAGLSWLDRTCLLLCHLKSPSFALIAPHKNARTAPTRYRIAFTNIDSAKGLSPPVARRLRLANCFTFLGGNAPNIGGASRPILTGPRAELLRARTPQWSKCPAQLATRLFDRASNHGPSPTVGAGQPRDPLSPPGARSARCACCLGTEPTVASPMASVGCTHEERMPRRSGVSGSLPP